MSELFMLLAPSAALITTVGGLLAAVIVAYRSATHTGKDPAHDVPLPGTEAWLNKRARAMKTPLHYHQDTLCDCEGTGLLPKASPLPPAGSSALRAPVRNPHPPATVTPTIHPEELAARIHRASKDVRRGGLGHTKENA